MSTKPYMSTKSNRGKPSAAQPTIEKVPVNAPLVSYAQNFEDVMLWRALRGVDEGFYIDIGAHEPRVDSVSRLFYEQGWKGIHVEPLPIHCDALRADRPDEVVVQAAVAEKAGRLTFFEIPNTGISTGDAEIADGHRKRGFDVNEISVPSVTLEHVFKLAKRRQVHWLKIDVEGLEGQVLKSWGKSTVRPWLVVVESTLPLTQVESHRSWERLLTDREYKFIYFDGLNRFYLSKQHLELRAAFSSGPNVFDGFSLSGQANSQLCRTMHEQLEHAHTVHAQALLTEQRAFAAREASLVGEAHALRAQLDAQVLHESELVAQLQDVHARVDQANQKNLEIQAALVANLEESQRTLSRHTAVAVTLAQREAELQQVRTSAETSRQHNETLHAEKALLAQRESQAQHRIDELGARARQAELEHAHERSALELKLVDAATRLEAEIQQHLAVAAHQQEILALNRGQEQTIQELIRSGEERAATAERREAELLGEVARLGANLAEQEAAGQALAESRDRALSQAREADEEWLRLFDALKQKIADQGAATARLEQALRETEARLADASAEAKANAHLLANARLALEGEQTARMNLEESLSAAQASHLRAAQLLHEQIRDRDARLVEGAEELAARLRRKDEEVADVLARMQTAVETAKQAFLRDVEEERLLIYQQLDQSAHLQKTLTAAVDAQVAANAALQQEVLASALRFASERLGDGSAQVRTLLDASPASMTAGSGTAARRGSLQALLALHGDEFVNAAYWTLLGRAPDPEGRSYYLNRLREGYSKVGLLGQLRRSGEGKAIVVPMQDFDLAIKKHDRANLPVIGAVLPGESDRPKDRTLRAVRGEFSARTESVRQKLEEIQASMASVRNLVEASTEKLSEALHDTRTVLGGALSRIAPMRPAPVLTFAMETLKLEGRPDPIAAVNGTGPLLTSDESIQPLMVTLPAGAAPTLQQLLATRVRAWKT
jgi:FkbM family methyltransferase